MPKSGGSAGTEREPAGKPAPAELMPFETALRRLEAVVSQLEQGEQPLEQALELFEEGIRLSRTLTARLETAQARIDQIVEGRDGRAHLTPLGAIPDAE